MTVRNGMPAAGFAGDSTALTGVGWRKSTRSGPQGGNCVEIGHLPDGRVAVRNSRFPQGPALIFTPAEWDAFTGGVKDGEFG